MKNPIYLFVLVLIAIAWTGCSEQELINYTDPDAPAPAQVSNLKVISGPGSAIITYDVPVDPNLSYVKAVYEIQPGVFHEDKTSYYNDTLKLEGFGDTATHAVKVYSVGKNEKMSEPLVVQITPLTPPVRTAFKSVQLLPTFGGVNLMFENSSQANLAFMLLLDTTGRGAWSEVTTYYTQASDGRFAARGFDSEEKTFAVVVKDRWNNLSDTLVRAITPLYEELIDKSLIKGVALPTDVPVLSTNNGIDRMFDGVTNGGTPYGTPNDSKFPQWFTFDFGQQVTISRFKQYQRPGRYAYSLSAVKKFELWGSNNPDADGSWENWQLLGTFDSFKPSGLPQGQYTDEDVNYAIVNGEDFEINDPVPAFRFIRFKTLETYDMGGQVAITELTFWGQVTQ